MSDLENYNISSIEEAEGEGELTESFSKLTPNSIKIETPGSVKVRSRKSTFELRHPRQKYCERWESDFPWLKADKTDESLGICTICEKQLVCKKSHLERHQNSFKHRRASGYEITYEKPGDPFAVFSDNGEEKHDSDDYELEQLESDEFTSTTQLKKKIKKESLKSIVPTSASRRKGAKSASQHTPKGQNMKLNRLKLLKRIDRDRNELNEYYYAHQRDISNSVISTNTSNISQRDSFDLFFESVSASAKALPPKLSFEIKSKISQLLSEFELRALCEKEALERAAREGNGELAPVLVSPSFEEQSKPLHVTTSIDASTVPHLVYTFQQKPQS